MQTRAAQIWTQGHELAKADLPKMLMQDAHFPETLLEILAPQRALTEIEEAKVGSGQRPASKLQEPKIVIIVLIKS